MNAVIVAIIATTQATLDLWYSVTTSSLIVAVWAVLAVQKRRLDRHRGERAVDQRL